MCRFSRCYRFHFIDQVLAGYRLHADSKTCSNPGEQIYAEATRVSRRYWGSPWHLRYWRLLKSLALTRLEQRYGRMERAADWWQTGQMEWLAGWPLLAFFYGVTAVLMAPDVAVRRGYYQYVVPRLRRFWPHLRGPARTWADPNLPGSTSAYRGFTGIHPDGYVGPYHEREFRHQPGAAVLPIRGAPVLPGAIYLNVIIDGRPVLRDLLPGDREFCLEVPTGDLSPGMHRLAISSSAFFVPSQYMGTFDFRPLAFRLLAPPSEDQSSAQPVRQAA
jgi:hypothetical protein